jgi:Phage portal protein, SPP1 Gp6-like
VTLAALPDLWLPTGYDPLRVLRELDHLLDVRQHALAHLSDYYEGEQRLAYSSDRWRRAFGGLFRDFADNWCSLVVDAVEERLNVTGFRFGNDSGDADAWHIWQHNNLDADSQIAHTDSLVYGESYALVWADANGRAKIDVESPEQTIVTYAPGSRRQRSAGLKRWQHDEDHVYATLYMPDALWKFVARSKGSWTAREEPGEQWPLPNPLGVVPIVPLVNRPRLRVRRNAVTQGVSEIAQVIPVQDAINKIVLDMLVASEFGSFRQRWVTGMEIPRDPETNQPVEPFKAAVDRLWMSENPATKFGEFNQTDLSPYVSSVEMLVQHVASQTRTPPHYFYLSGRFPSGESIKSAETGLVAKARRKMRHLSEAWEEVMRLAFAVEDDERADFTEAETIWADPESRTEGEHTDATLKKRALGVPLQQLWIDLGYSPQEIARFKEMHEEMATWAVQPVLPPAPRRTRIGDDQ